MTEAPRKGRSLGRDAWLRLRKNRLAVVGAVVTVVMGLSAIFAEWIMPFSPTAQEGWVGARPPGFSHWTVTDSMYFAAGAPLEDFPVDLGSAQRRLEITFGRYHDQEAWLSVTDGVVTAIRPFPERVAVRGPGEYFEVTGRRVRDVALGTLEFLPAWTQTPGRQFSVEDVFGTVRTHVYPMSAGISGSWEEVVVHGQGDQRRRLTLRIEDGQIKEIRPDAVWVAGAYRVFWIPAPGGGAPVRDRRIDVGKPLPDFFEVQGRKVKVIERSGIRDLAHPLPPDLRGTWSEVFSLRTYKALEPSRAEIVVERGVVTSVVVDGRNETAATIDGRFVSRILLDGSELRHTHLLGTDTSGRDLFSRIVFGARISLLIGLVATLVSLLIGVLYGAIAGYAGGWIDSVMMRFVDILYAVPYMFLVILLLMLAGRNIVVLFLALGAVQWLTMARIVRGQVLSLKQKEFIEAARASGAAAGRIIATHLIPNTFGIVAVYTTLTVPAVILQEAFLAYIGLTVEWQGEALDSWGALTRKGYDALGLAGENWWLLVFPALALAVTLFSLNFLGDGLRDAVDPQQKGRT